MILENRYGLSSDQVKRLVNDGIIPCSVVNHYQVFEQFERFKSECPSCSQADLFRRVEDRTGVDFWNVKKIVQKLGKI